MDAEALRDLREEKIEAELPDRPVTSVRDLQSLYGALYALGRGLSGEYGPFLSPDAAAELIGMERLVVVRVDVDDGITTLADDPVFVSPYTEVQPRPTRGGIVPDVQHVAHAKFEAARGVDHSITHISGQSNGPDKHADHASERFTRWPSEDAVQAEAAAHDDGWLLEALDALGNDDEAMDRIRDAVADATQEGQYLHTVAIRFDSGSVATTDQFDPDATWHLPGEIEVLQEAMVRRKTTKFRAKNKATEASGGGVCYVNDTEEDVYGVVDDPLKWYLSKQMERFPRFDPDQSWRTQGLGREAAIAAQNATTFLDACADSGPGVSVFYFPYFEQTPTVGDARALYRTLVQQAENGDERNAVARLYNDLRDRRGKPPEDLRFIFMVVEKYQKDRWRLLAFEPDGTTHYGVELATAHDRAIDSPVFGEEGPLPIREGFDLLNTGLNRIEWLPVVTGVGYFVRTCSPPDDDDDPSSDDIRFRATRDVVSGRPLDAESMLSAYVDRIVDRFEPDDEYPFPGATVAEQHAQLTALANSGLLDANADTDFTVDTDMTESTITDGEEMSRSETLDDFIDRHDALSNGERQGIFALGALVGRISRYQRSKSRSMTAVKQHPIDKLTGHNVTQVATEVIDANVVYSDTEGYSGTMYAELMDEVVDGLLSRSPEDWDLTTEDLRYHYALGIAYGLNDRSTSDYDNE
jgi:hypothetical protein